MFQYTFKKTTVSRPVSVQEKIFIASGAVALGTAHGLACYILRTPLAIIAGVSTARRLYRNVVADLENEETQEEKPKPKAKASAKKKKQEK